MLPFRVLHHFFYHGCHCSVDRCGPWASCSSSLVFIQFAKGAWKLVRLGSKNVRQEAKTLYLFLVFPALKKYYMCQCLQKGNVYTYTVLRARYIFCNLYVFFQRVVFLYWFKVRWFCFVPNWTLFFLTFFGEGMSQCTVILFLFLSLITIVLIDDIGLHAHFLRKRDTSLRVRN